MPISWTLDGEKRLVYVTLTAPYTVQVFRT